MKKEAEVKEQEPAQNDPPATKVRILVVNDEEPIREIIPVMLTTAGYSCLTAAGGLEALDVLASGEEFDLLISNLIMPGPDGIGLLERT